MAAKKYDSTVACIAGNILCNRPIQIVPGSRRTEDEADQDAVEWCVKMARLIVAETQRTEPEVLS